MQATGLKELTSDPASKRLKGDTLADPVEAETSGSTPRDNMVAEKSAEHATPSNSTALQESPSSRPLIRPLAPLGARAPFMLNRFKLDNRPTSFKVVSPLPDGLANVISLSISFFTFYFFFFFS